MGAPLDAFDVLMEGIIIGVVTASILLATVR